MTLAELTSCVAERWSPQIGDPNLRGWLTVGSYLLCFVLAVAVLRRAGPHVARGLWALIAVLMLFLAVNKQLDLQSAITATGRCLAYAQGWYANRRTAQLAFIAALLGMVLIALLIGLVSLRGRVLRNGLALIGLAVTCGFVMVRAVGFHHFDYFLGTRILGTTANFVFENTGLALIAINAVLLLRMGYRRSSRIAHG